MTVLVGDVELVPVLDAVGLLAEYADAYPQVPADAWEPYRALYPELFAGASWRLPCRSFLIRSEGVSVLVSDGHATHIEAAAVGQVEAPDEQAVLRDVEREQPVAGMGDGAIALEQRLRIPGL